ncbi:unnamed protein product [Camellia sinensis]
MYMDEQEDYGGRHSRASASRRTRSQVAPDWSSPESLTLITEIAAVERDCRNTLSSFQKWKIIVENCNSLEVLRTLNQCRRKWDSLLSDYKKIKLWESSESRVESYWSIDYERRCEFGFPEDFDFEVFKAIDDHLKVGDGSDTDPDVDPEAVADGVAEPGSAPVQAISQNMRCLHLCFCTFGTIDLKKQRRRVMPQKRSTEERVTPQKRKINKKIMPEQGRVEKRVKPLKHSKDEKILLKNSMEEKEQMMAAKLYENAELIADILKGVLGESSDCLLADLKNVKDSQTDFTRHQGDRLITCLGNLADTLDQLCDIVQDCGYSKLEDHLKNLKLLDAFGFLKLNHSIMILNSTSHSPIYLGSVNWIHFLQLALFTVISSVKSLR